MALKISQGSGATLATNILNGEHLQVISPVSLYPLPTGSNSIGFVSIPSINGTVAISGTPSVTVSNSPTVSLGHLLSLASGQVIGLNPGTNYIGLVSVSGNVNISNTPSVSQSGTWNIGVTGLISLASGTEIRSLATVLNFPSTQAVTQSGTWTVQPGNTANTTPWLTTQSGGLISLASGTEVRSLATILNFPATQNVALTHLVSLASGTFVSLNAGSNHVGSVTIFGNVTANTGMTTLFPGPNFIGLVTTVPGSNITLNPSSAHIGSVSIFGTVNTTTGMTTLFPGPNQIGSVTISNTPAVTQSGTWTVQPGNTANSTPWLVTQTGGLLSLASGTEIKALATILNFPATQAVSFSQLVSLASGTEIRSLATIINNVNIVPIGNITLNASSAHIGSVSIFGTITTGMVTIFPGPNQIGSVTISNTVSVSQSGTWTVQPGNTANTTPWLVTQTAGLISLASGTEIRSLATIVNTVNALASVVPNFTPVTSNYTSLATAISASGNATLFIPPSNQRWILKDLIIGSQGQTQVGVLSGTKTVIPPIALASMGGYVSNFGDGGFRGAAQNDSFVIVNNSAVTISVTANVRFEA